MKKLKKLHQRNAIDLSNFIVCFYDTYLHELEQHWFSAATLGLPFNLFELCSSLPMFSISFSLSYHSLFPPFADVMMEIWLIFQLKWRPLIVIITMYAFLWYHLPMSLAYFPFSFPLFYFLKVSLQPIFEEPHLKSLFLFPLCSLPFSLQGM